MFPQRNRRKNDCRSWSMKISREKYRNHFGIIKIWRRTNPFQYDSSILMAMKNKKLSTHTKKKPNILN